jgi:hypothetical protein
MKYYSLLVVLAALWLLGVPARGGAQQFQCTGCTTLPPVFSGTGGSVTFPDNSQLLLIVTPLGNGSCFKENESCLDDTPCRFYYQWAYNLGNCGGVASFEYRLNDSDDPENNNRIGGPFPNPAGDLTGEAEVYCGAKAGFGITLDISACSGNPAYSREIGVAMECTKCGKLYL